MKKLLLVALGLGMMAGQTEAKLNITMESATGLIKAVEQLPENLLDIRKKIACAQPNACTDQEKFKKDKGKITQMPQSIEATYYSLVKSANALKYFSKAELKGKSKKAVALYKIENVSDVIDLVVKFLDLSLDVNSIVKDKIILPILDLAGQQGLLEPLNTMVYQITQFKNKLNDVNTEVKDILELVKMLMPIPESEVAEDASGKKK